MQTFVQKPIHRPRPPEESGFEVAIPTGPSALTVGVQEGAASTLESIDAALAIHAVLGKLSVDATVFAANRPNLAKHLPHEQEASAAFYRFLGRPAIAGALAERKERSEIVQGSKATLAQSIELSKKGNEEAEARVDIAIATATSEAFFRRTHITRIKKTVNEVGEVVQFGLTTEQMHSDSVVHRPHRPQELKEFTKQEVRNGFREQELMRNGVLDDAWIVVASFVPKNMPEKLLDHRGDGYFTRTMTYSMQGTTKEGADIITKTIFDQGTAASEDASYEERQNKRFDLPAYQRVCEWLGVPVPRDELEALGSPLVISKKIMPNGMLDFWRWMDVAADEIRGKYVVRTIDEYVTREQLSREREASIVDVQAKIKKELLAVGGFTNDLQAVELLWELTRRHGYKAAARNDFIEPMVFGKGARKLLVAKNFISLGQDDDANRWIEHGLQEASVGGCGGGACGLRDLAPGSPEFFRAKSMLNFKEGDSVTLDEERPCMGCGKIGSVVYVYNANKVNKGCLDCGATEFSSEAE